MSWRIVKARLSIATMKLEMAQVSCKDSIEFVRVCPF
jgi:hypothetical protein